MTLDEIIATAAAEGWKIRPPTLVPEPIVAPTGEIVGFFCPHPAGRGRWRAGPIYVIPAYRGQGLAAQAYEALAGRLLIAYTHAGNRASERLHERVGFVRWYQTAGGWFWRRDP